jgi:hypothetical protein
MTSDGVDGTAEDGRPAIGRGDGAPGPVLINRDDELLASRYIEAAYPHTPAGAVPHSPWRELQVASALRNDPDLLIASFSFGAGGPAGRACACLFPAKRLR